MHELLKNLLREDGLVGFIDRSGNLRLTVVENSEGDVLVRRNNPGDSATHYMLRPDDKLIPITVFDEGCLERARSA